LVEGSIPNYKDELNNEVLISKTLAKALKLSLGDQCNAFFLKDESSQSLPNQRRFTVSGIYDSGFDEFDKSYIMLDIRHLQRINRWNENQVGLIEVFIDDFDSLDSYADTIYKQSSSQLDVRTVKDRYFTIFEWIELFDFNIALIIGIMILVGGINIVTALLVLVLEKTNTIGVLKALGASNWTIRKIFIYQAIYLVIRGLFWGNVIGLSLLGVQYFFRLIQFPNPKEYFMSYIPVSISMSDILFLNIGIVIISFGMLLVPSFVVSKISVIKSIKFD
jgi:lipoprotein-releasing system permease protein